jgi:hypothetical protein
MLDISPPSSNPLSERAEMRRKLMIKSSISTCRNLLNRVDKLDRDLLEAAYVLLLIHLNDLVGVAAKDGKRIVFIEDVADVEGVEDVTDMITKCRNAAVHIKSPLSNVSGSGTLKFIRVIGKIPNAFVIDGKAIGSDYADDVAIFYGEYRLYVGRNIIRALNEIEAIYLTN